MVPRTLRVAVQTTGRREAAGRRRSSHVQRTGSAERWPLQQALAKLKAIPGVVDADTSLVVGKPELSVLIDRAGPPTWVPSRSRRALRLLVGGEKVTTYEEEGEQYDVHVRAEDRTGVRGRHAAASGARAGWAP